MLQAGACHLDAVQRGGDIAPRFLFRVFRRSWSVLDGWLGWIDGLPPCSRHGAIECNREQGHGQLGVVQRTILSPDAKVVNKWKHRAPPGQTRCQHPVVAHLHLVPPPCRCTTPWGRGDPRRCPPQPVHRSCCTDGS
ncbi:hypothetical protein AMP9_4058 [plant metagenome]|uniref:Uncharacterized protein n=1 Tax=plant metagenome TaxID=1297885 RepID=A0A484PB73_9ZZZZ